MAKRIKNKFASKGRKSALRVESLEQRQLLATITGAGIEVGTDIHHQNGNVYDQVLMTGSSVTVANDPGQITRVSFLDLQGDIVQAEFSGAGTLTVSMDPTGYHTDVAPTDYNQTLDFVGPDGTHYTGYVEGLASFTIQNSDATTNIAIFSVGSGNAVNSGLFDATHTGGDHVADVQKLVIVANPANPNGSAFGSIYAGDTIFEGSSGTVGIAANNVQVQGTVTIGNIDASDSAVPTLAFGNTSQFSNVNVTMGNLLSTNGAIINDGNGVGGLPAYGYGINFTAGTDSAGHTTPANILGSGVTFTGAGHNVTTLDASTDIYIDDGAGHTISQDQLDALFLNRTFTNDVTIHGVLQSGFYIDAAAFKGNVEFTGDIMGHVTLDNINGTLTPSAVFAKNVTFDGNLGGTVSAETFHNITVDGNLTGTVSSTEDSAWVVGSGHIGNVTVDGDFSGQLLSAWDLGNIWIGGDVTSASTSFVTWGAGGLYVGNIGTITVVGDVNQDGGLLCIAGAGTFGNVTIEGNGDQGATDTIGSLYVNQLAAGQTAVGSVTVTDAVVSDGGTGISFGGVTIDNNAGAVGAISITGGNTEANTSIFDLTGNLNAGSFGNISVSGFSNVTIDGAIAAHTGAIGNIMFSTTGGSKTAGNAINLNGDITAHTSIGNILIDAGDAYSSADLCGNITAGTDIASLFVNSDSIDVHHIDVSATKTLGNVTLYAYGDLETHGDFYGGTSVGDVTFHAGAAVGDYAGGTLSAHGSILSYGAVGDIAFSAGGDIWTGTDVVGASVKSFTAITSGGNINSWSDIGNGVGPGEAATAIHSAVGDVTFTATKGDVTLHGSSSIEGDTIGMVSVTAGGDVSVSGSILSKTSTGDIAFAAGGDLYFCGDIGGLSKASTAIGDVSFTTTDGNIDVSSSGWIGDLYTASLGAVSLVAHGHDYYDSVSKSVKWGNGDVTVCGYIVANDSIDSITLDAHDSAGALSFSGHIGSASEDGDVGGQLAIGAISFLGNSTVASHDGKSTLDYGDGTISGTIGDWNTASIASITATAAQNLTISADITAGNQNTDYVNAKHFTTADTTGTIGDVTFTATAGSLTDCGDITAATALGNVSMSGKTGVTVSGDIYSGFEYITPTYKADGKTLDYNNDFYIGGTVGNVTFSSSKGDVSVCSYIDGATIGDISFTAGGSNSFSGWVGQGMAVAATKDSHVTSFGTDVGDVTFTAGSAGTNSICGGFEVDTAGSFTFNGTTNLDAWCSSNIQVESADMIVFNGVANVTEHYCNPNIVVGYAGADEGVLHGLSFNGDGTVGTDTVTADQTYLVGTVLDSTLGTIDGGGDAAGVALHFTQLLSDGCTLKTHTVGNAVFDGNTVFTDGTFWAANDGTSALDTIGNLTFNGTVTGTGTTTDIQASSIGDITIKGPLDLSNKVLVTDFTVYAGNNTGTLDSPGEALSSSTNVLDGAAFNTAFTDGANIGNFKIGNITVQDTQTFGFSGTALFSGANNFNAIGGIGNVKLLGGGTVTKQDALFDTSSATLTITAGDFGSASNAIHHCYGMGFDLDGIGGIGWVVDPGQTASAKNAIPTVYGVDPFLDTYDYHLDGKGAVYGPTGTEYTSGQVLLTAVTDAVDQASLAEYNASFSQTKSANVAVSIGNIEINAALDSADNPDTILNATGLTILSAVTPGDLHNGDLPQHAGTNLSGSIGNVFVHNMTQVLDMYNSEDGAIPPSGAEPAPVGYQAWWPGMIAGTSVGTVQTLGVTGLSTGHTPVSGDAVILGNDQNYDWPQGASPDELVVIVI